MALAALCLLVPAAGHAGEPAPKNLQRLEDILRHAWRTNPNIQAAREELHATQELVPQAQAGWKPSADATAGITKAWLDGDNFGGSGTTEKTIGVNFSEPLYRGGRTVTATRSARNTVRAQTALLNDAEQQLMLNVTTAYMNLLETATRVSLVRNYRSLIGKQLDASRARFEAGDATSTDIAQGESRMAGADALLAEAEGGMNKAGAVYKSLTGMEPGLMGYPVLSFAFPAGRDGVAGQARRDNPLVIAGHYLHEASQADVDTIFGELLPRLSLNGSWNRQFDPQPGLVDEATERTIGVSATIPLYEAGSVRSRVRQAKHEANRRYLSVLAAGRDAERDAVSSWDDLQTAHATIKAREIQVRTAEAALQGVQKETELGTRTILDELDAGLEVLNARTSLASARRDEIVAEFTLARNLGLLTPEALGFSDAAEDHGAHLRHAEDKILGMDVELEKADY